MSRRAQGKRNAATEGASGRPAPRRKRGKVASTAADGPLTRVAAALNDQVTNDSTAKPQKPRPATRRNKKGLVLYVDPEVSLALRRLALDTGETVQSLGLRALALLFERHGIAMEPWGSACR